MLAPKHALFSVANNLRGSAIEEKNEHRSEDVHRVTNCPLSNTCEESQKGDSYDNIPHSGFITRAVRFLQSSNFMRLASIRSPTDSHECIAETGEQCAP